MGYVSSLAGNHPDFFGGDQGFPGFKDFFPVQIDEQRDQNSAILLRLGAQGSTKNRWLEAVRIVSLMTIEPLADAH